MSLVKEYSLPCIKCREPTVVDETTCDNIKWKRAFDARKDGVWNAPPTDYVLRTECLELYLKEDPDFKAWMTVVGPVYDWNLSNDIYVRLVSNDNSHIDEAIVTQMDIDTKNVKPSDRDAFKAMAKLVCMYWATEDERQQIYDVVPELRSADLRF